MQIRKFLPVVIVGLAVIGIGASIFDAPRWAESQNSEYPCIRNDNSATVVEGRNLGGSPCITNDKGEVVVRFSTPPPFAATVVFPVDQQVTFAGTAQPVIATITFPTVAAQNTQIPFQTAAPAEITAIPIVTVLATAVPTAFGTPQFVNAAPMIDVTCYNGTNQIVMFALNGSTTPYFELDIGQAWTHDLGNKNAKQSTSIAIARPGTLPTSGSAKCWATAK